MHNLIILVLCLPLFSCVNNKSIIDTQTTLPNTLHTDIVTDYNNGQSILLFAYNNAFTSTEAYADWATYLNDFKQTTGAKFKFHRIKTDSLKSAIPDISGISEFSVFIKKGAPSYLYKDFIVEPQVYTAVFHVYNQKKLTVEDKNFLPKTVSLITQKK